MLFFHMDAGIASQCWHCLGSIRWRKTWAKPERRRNTKTTADTPALVCDWKTYWSFPWAKSSDGLEWINSEEVNGAVLIHTIWVFG